MNGSQVPTLTGEVDRVARKLGQRNFPEVGRGMREAMPAMLNRWRSYSRTAMPELDHLTSVEFENTVAALLDSVAAVMECRDAERVRRFIQESPNHGVARFIQKCSPATLLAEERLLRTVIVVELRNVLGRPLETDEAATLHELMDLMSEYSILAMVSHRSDEREGIIQRQISGVHRLADLGTLVAGLAHDATNLLLPLRIRLDRLKRSDLTPEARADLESIALIVKQFQNAIINLRWLSVDSAPPSTAEIDAAQHRPPVALDLSQWATEIGDFHTRMLPPHIGLRFDVPAGLPKVAISTAALSQSVFNLIHNAQQAITAQQAIAAQMADSARLADSTGTAVPPSPAHVNSTHPASKAVPGGQIVVSAGLREDGSVDLVVEDNGPGMTPEVLSRCSEPFFTTREGGSGLGLALVRALMTGGGCSGRLMFISPPPGKPSGTRVILTLPPSPSDTTPPGPPIPSNLAPAR